MLKALVYGAVAAFVGSKLKKMNDEGRLEPYKEQARKSAQQFRDRMAEQRSAGGSSAGARSAAMNKSATNAQPDTSNDVSKPAQAHPWPVDPKAMPSGA